MSAPAIAVYGAVGSLLRPLAAPYLSMRARRGKEDPARLAEKRGVVAPGVQLPDRPVWIHAVSAGEAGVAVELARRLHSAGHESIITTVTPAGAQRVENAGLAHLYAPLDVPAFIDRFLRRVAPVAALFVEAEVWPTTLSRLAAREVPYAHVNARVSERSFKRWQRLPGVAASIFGTIQTALCQSAADANRLATLGVGETSVTGNIKFDAPPPSADPQAVADLKAAIGGQPVWVAASIHKEEADEVVSVHHALCARHDGLITLCVPRHPAAADAVEAAFPGAVRRSTGALPRPGIYLADTFGEMGTMLSLSPVVFLGGSLVRRGGHNPAEPAAFGAAIVTGPSHGPMFQPFLDAGAAQMVSDSRGLCEVVDGLLRDPERCARMGAAASAVRQAQMGALDRTMDGLRGILADAAATA